MDNTILEKLDRIENLLNLQKVVFNINEVCEFTGLSKSHMYKLTMNGKIPHYKQAKHLYFDRIEIEAWLKENRGFNYAEIEQQAINFVVLGKKGGGIMFLDSYYKGEKISDAKIRYDITESNGNYPPFEVRLINKRKFNIGGLSFNCGNRPIQWKNKSGTLAITKKNNITTIIRPDITSTYSHGTIFNTEDGCIIVFNKDFKKVGINTVEVFISEGNKNDIKSIWNMLENGDLDIEMAEHRKNAKSRYTPIPDTSFLNSDDVTYW